MEKYAECHKTHSALAGKTDGCQEYEARITMYGDTSDYCEVCECHRKFHRKVEQPVVVYTTCQKVHDFKVPNSVDGCQEFQPTIGDDLTCDVCGCHRGFHKKEIIITKLVD